MSESKPKWKDRVKTEMTSWFKLISNTNKGGMSNEFFDLIKAIGEAKSKQEEDKIVEREAKVLQSIINLPENSKNMKEYVIRLIYCEMLGHDVSFGYINAVKMTQEPKILDKRVGYLAASVFLSREHEFIILLISSFRRDLVSTNHLHVCAALTTITYLINVETIPAILPLVVDLLQHDRANVRKKAVMALHRFYLLSPDSIAHLHDHVRRVLCDRDPSVMGATLCLLHDLVKDNRNAWKDLVHSFVNILKQVILNKLSRHYEYHHVPAPWIQVKLLRLLAMLGQDDKKTSDMMYETLAEVLKKANGKNNASYAVSYECIKTITSIYPRPALLEMAAESIATFITGNSNNLKYLGIDALGVIIQIDPRHAQKHQLQVIGCLQDPDDTLKRKTLDLLYKMTNPMNVVTITDRLIQHLRQTQDQYLRTELVSRITQIAERYAPDNEWFIDTMIQVFLLGGELVRPLVAHNLMQLIAEGSEDEEADAGLRTYAVTAFYSVLSGQRETPGGLGLAKTERLPDILVHLGAWILSEYAYLSESYTIPQILSVLSELIEKPHTDAHTRGWLVTAIMKLVAQLGSYPPLIEEIVARYKRSSSLDLQQRCYEFEAIVQNPSLMEEVLPLDASMEDVEVDKGLSFLDDFVQQALAKGAKPHVRPSDRSVPTAKKSVKGLNWEKYDTPNLTTYTAKPGAIYDPPTQPSAPTALSEDTTTNLKVNKLGKWSAKGYSELPVPASTPAAPSPTFAGYDSTPYSPQRAPAVHEEISARADPRQLAEAEELFKGLAGTTGGEPHGESASRKSRRPLGTKKPAYGKDKQGIRGGDNGPAVNQNLFFGLDTAGTPPAAKEPSKSAASGKSESMLLFDLDFPQESSLVSPLQQSRPSVPTAQPLPPSSLGALFDGMALVQLPPSPAVPSSPSAASRQNFLIDDDDDLLGGPGPGGLQAPVHSLAGEKEVGILPTKMVMTQRHYGNLDFCKLILPSHLASRIDSASRSFDTNKLVAEDAASHLSYYLSYTENETAVVLFIANKTQNALSNVVATLQPPTNLNVSCFTVEGGEVKQSGDKVEFVFSNLPEQSVVVSVLLFTFREHSFNMNIKATVAYVDNHKSNRHVVGNIPVLISDLIRPHKINSTQYGEKWLSSKQEGKARIISPKLADVPSLVALVQKQFHLAHVHTIGVEAIFSGRLIGEGENTHCLLHAKLLAAANVEVTVRSTNKFYTEAIVRCVERLLQ